MKNKSGHRRRTKVVRRSRKNLRRTVKRKSLGKGRRHPTRRYSRVQRGGWKKRENKYLEQGIRYEWVGDTDVTIRQRTHSWDLAMIMYNNAIKESDDDYATQARFRLGVMHEEGKGVVQNYAKAAEYYKDVVTKGDTSKFKYDPVTEVKGIAAFKLGEMYEEGRGVAQDIDTAIKYYKLAADEENEHATEALNRLGVPND